MTLQRSFRFLVAFSLVSLVSLASIPLRAGVEGRTGETEEHMPPPTVVGIIVDDGDPVGVSIIEYHIRRVGFRLDDRRHADDPAPGIEPPTVEEGGLRDRTGQRAAGEVEQQISRAMLAVMALQASYRSPALAAMLLSRGGR